MMFVTLEQARAHLRSDTTADDNDVILKIEAATEACLDYMEDGADGFVNTANMDSAGNPITVPRKVQAATLLMLGYLFKDRDNDENHEYEMGYLPRPVMALLYSYRTPTVE